MRAPYKNLPGLLDRCFGRESWPIVLCLTATLDANSQKEILRDFRLTKSAVVRSANMLRTNLDLSFEVFKDANEKLAALTRILDDHRGGKLIVYAHRKKSKTQGRGPTCLVRPSSQDQGRRSIFQRRGGNNCLMTPAVFSVRVFAQEVASSKSGITSRQLLHVAPTAEILDCARSTDVRHTSELNLTAQRSPRCVV